MKNELELKINNKDLELKNNQKLIINKKNSPSKKLAKQRYDEIVSLKAEIVNKNHIITDLIKKSTLNKNKNNEKDLNI